MVRVETKKCVMCRRKGAGGSAGGEERNKLWQSQRTRNVRNGTRANGMACQNLSVVRVDPVLTRGIQVVGWAVTVECGW